MATGVSPFRRQRREGEEKGRKDERKNIFLFPSGVFLHLEVLHRCFLSGTFRTPWIRIRACTCSSRSGSTDPPCCRSSTSCLREQKQKTILKYVGIVRAREHLIFPIAEKGEGGGGGKGTFFLPSLSLLCCYIPLAQGQDERLEVRELGRAENGEEEEEKEQEPSFPIFLLLSPTSLFSSHINIPDSFPSSSFLVPPCLTLSRN